MRSVMDARPLRWLTPLRPGMAPSAMAVFWPDPGIDPGHRDKKSEAPPATAHGRK